jgi:hypothetical protein
MRPPGTQSLTYRIYWIQLIFDAGCLPLFYLILSETRGEVILARKAKKMRQGGREVYAASELEGVSLKTAVVTSFKRPTTMLFTEFVVFAFTLWVSFGE